MQKKKKVSFWAFKEIKKPVRVSFTTSTGERVSFEAVKKEIRPVKVIFYRKKKKLPWF